MGTHLRAASRGGGRPGRGEGAAGSPARRGTVLGAQRARAPPAGFQVAQSAGGSRPPGPAPHPAHRSSGAARSGPPLHSAPLGRSAPGSLPAPGLSVAPRLRRSSQPGEGLVLLAHEGGNPPPLCSPTPEPAPLPGIRSKKRTGAPGPGVRSPPPARTCPQLGRCARSAGRAPAHLVWTLAQTLCPCLLPFPHSASWGFHAAGAPAAAPGILGSEQGRGASRNLSFPIRNLESDKEQAQRGLWSRPRPPLLRVSSS